MNWSLGVDPGQGDDVQLDGRPFTNHPVYVTNTTTVHSVTTQNGYNSTITLDSDVVLKVTNGFHFDDGMGTMVTVNFDSNGSELYAAGGASAFKNFHFTGARG